ncbi:hypothetical protein ACSS7Z_01200 [Microbacterium sp. A82]|uniref:hypothetical protein n=1 Tax=Microbacterium sp. A82 TaxID=3450452 RepID=UPI003F2EF3C4
MLFRSNVEDIAFDAGSLEEALQDARAFPPTGGTRFTLTELLSLRQQLLEASALADNAGVSEHYAIFDLEIGRVFEQFGRETHGDFGNPQVWDFLTLVLVPDLAARRLGGLIGSPSEKVSVFKRITGGDRRHIFQKLWKRWRVFGPDIVDSGQLTEDDYVATLERRITLERRQLARRVAGAIIESGYTGSARRMYARTFMRNLQQVSGLVRIRDDDADSVRTIVTHVHQQTLLALG